MSKIDWPAFGGKAIFGCLLVSLSHVIGYALAGAPVPFSWGLQGILMVAAAAYAFLSEALA